MYGLTGWLIYGLHLCSLLTFSSFISLLTSKRQHPRLWLFYMKSIPHLERYNVIVSSSGYIFVIVCEILLSGAGRTILIDPKLEEPRRWSGLAEWRWKRAFEDCVDVSTIVRPFFWRAHIWVQDGFESGDKGETMSFAGCLSSKWKPSPSIVRFPLSHYWSSAPCAYNYLEISSI